MPENDDIIVISADFYLVHSLWLQHNGKIYSKALLCFDAQLVRLGLQRVERHNDDLVFFLFFQDNDVEEIDDGDDDVQIWDDNKSG